MDVDIPRLKEAAYDWVEKQQASGSEDIKDSLKAKLDSLGLPKVADAKTPAQAKALMAFFRGNSETRSRAVSVKAKNIQIGDLVEWGYGLGQQIVNGAGSEPDRVLLSTQKGFLWPLDPDQRVRVYRG